MTQLRRSIACARKWSRYLLGDDSIGQRKRVRAVLDLNERVFRKCLHSNNFRRLALDHEIEPFAAVLVDERLPAKFREHRYPANGNADQDRSGTCAPQPAALAGIAAGLASPATHNLEVHALEGASPCRHQS